MRKFYGLVIAILCGFGLQNMALATELPSEIKLKVGAGPETSTYAFGTLVTEYFSQYLPGNPKVEMESVEGGAGLLLQRQMVVSEPADGSVIALIFLVSKYADIMDTVGFDPSDIRLAGAFSSGVPICYSVTGRNPDLSDPSVKLGAINKSSSTYLGAYLLRAIKGGNFQIVVGYKNGAAVKAALERGEIDLYCGDTDQGFDLENKDKTFDVIYSFGKSKSLGEDVSEDILESAIPSEYKELTELFLLNFVQNYHLFLPGRTPDEIVNIYRESFAKLVKDPAFVQAAQDSNLTIDPVLGQQSQMIVDKAYSISDELKAQMKALKAE